MMYKAFFDTNILAYEFDTKEYKKQVVVTNLIVLVQREMEFSRKKIS